MRLCGVVMVPDQHPSVSVEAVAALQTLVTPSLSSSAVGTALASGVPDTDVCPGLSSLLAPTVMDCMAMFLQEPPSGTVAAVLELLTQVAVFPSGCKAIVSCGTLVRALSALICNQQRCDDLGMYHALRLHISLCAVPASRAAIESGSSWLYALLVDSCGTPADGAGGGVGTPSALHMRYRRVVDVLANDASSRRLMLRANVVRDLAACLQGLVEHVNPDGTAASRHAVTGLLRNLLCPLCEDPVACAEVADNSSLVACLLSLLRLGLCVRETVTVLSLVSGCPSGAAVLAAASTNCVPVMASLALEAGASSTGADGDSGDLLRQAALQCLARLCSEPESALVVWQHSGPGEGPSGPSDRWQAVLSDRRPGIRYRGLLTLRYLVVHNEGRRLLCRSPLWANFLSILIDLLKHAGSTGDDVAVVELAAETLGGVCRPYANFDPYLLELLQQPCSDALTSMLDRAATLSDPTCECGYTGGLC
jgi:hypothetical protein